MLHIQSLVNWFPVGKVYTWTPTVQYNVQYLEYTQVSPVWCRVHVDTHVVALNQYSYTYRKQVSPVWCRVYVDTHVVALNQYSYT